MATNTGSNGGKNNTGGVIRGNTEGFPERGLSSALEQRAYRQEYANKVFDKDNGYLANNIKVLQDQAEYYEKMLKSSKDLDKVQTKMYQKRLAEVRQLEAQTKQMQDKREASENEISSVLVKAHKARLKQLDDECQRELNNIKAVGKAREEQQRKIASNYAAEKELIQDELDEIETAADKAGKATKKVSTGLAESIKDITSGIMNLTNMINIQSMADNEYTKKANERYEIINKLNRSLGYDVQQGTAAYNSITSEFKTFNSNIGNLFNIDDMREYMQNAASMGLTNEKALRDNLQQSIIANKYMGLNYDTQTSMYKYMKITNNNDAIASYNKMMVALTRKNVGVNEDMLSEMIKNGQTTNDILAASGVDVTQYNQGKIAMIGSLKKEKGYTDDMAQQAVAMVDNAIQSLYNGDYQSLVGMGINPTQLNNMVTGNASFDQLYDLVLGGRSSTSASAKGIGYGMIGTGEYNRATGRDVAGELISRIYGENDTETAKELIEEAKTISDQQVENYTNQNTAISNLTRWVNANNTWLEDTFGNSWFNYESMATAFFVSAIAGNVLNAVIGIGKGVGGLSKFFGTGGGFSGLLGVTSSGGATSGGLAGLLGSAGPIALGIAGVAAGIAVLSNITSKAVTTKEKVTNDRLSNAMSELKNNNSPLANDESYANVYAQAKMDKVNKSGWDAYWGIFANLTSGYMNNFTTDDPEKHNEEVWRNFARGTAGVSDDINRYVDLKYMYSIMLDKVGTPSVSEKLFGIDKEAIKSYVRNVPNAEKRIKDAYEYYDTQFVDNWGAKWPIDFNKKDFDGNLSLDGYHLAGLDRVPKDNYRALLHKDEMILNKAEAEKYRRMGYGIGGSLDVNAADYVGPHHSGYDGHKGIDLYFSSIGTPVGSAVPGTVIESRDIAVDWKDGKYHGQDTNGNYYSSYGRVVKVRGNDGHTYIYGHLNERAVNSGDRVDAGTLLGYSGTTGNSTGPHLHFEVDGAGTGEAAHAKYYTPYVRSANGAAAHSGTLPISSDSSSSSDTRRGLTLAAVNNSGIRAIPGIGGSSNSSGPSSTDRIVSSVDGVSTKIIKYLDEIRQEQADQRRLINAFSASQSSIEDYR